MRNIYYLPVSLLAIALLVTACASTEQTGTLRFDPAEAMNTSLQFALDDL